MRTPKFRLMGVLAGMSVIILAAKPLSADETAATTQHDKQINPKYDYKVVCEEEIITYQPPNNGSGQLWCYGSPTLVRHGDSVFASAQQTGADVPPQCNTRWQLWQRRDGQNWQCLQQGSDYNEREPFPMVQLNDGRIWLSVNPAYELRNTDKNGIKTWYAHPQLLIFSATEPQNPPTAVIPDWQWPNRFTEHSYRGAAADPSLGEILLFNNEDAANVWCLLDRQGKTLEHGSLRFPKRGCYLQIILKNRAAYILALGDIHEPNQQWRAYKKQITGKDWDYDFRDLFFCWTPAIGKEPFSPPLTISSRDETCGNIHNGDMFLDPAGTIHILYRVQNIGQGMMRDKFWPDTPIQSLFEYAQIANGQVCDRQTLYRSTEKTPLGSAGYDGNTPSRAMFHTTPDGSLFMVFNMAAKNPDGSSSLKNFIRRLIPPGDTAETPLELRNPFTSFFVASTRMGNEPSYTLDIVGNTAAKPDTLCYAQIKIQPQ